MDATYLKTVSAIDGIHDSENNLKAESIDDPKRSNTLISVYAIEDNPLLDIVGANTHGWTSGITMIADHVVEDVGVTVKLAL